MTRQGDSVAIRERAWATLTALHGLIQAALEPTLQEKHDLSVVEFAVMDALWRQEHHHLRMQRIIQVTGLSASATTRLVNRLENRGLLTRFLCADDRRGIYTQLTGEGAALLAQARPTHEAILKDALGKAEEMPELAPLVAALLHPAGSHEIKG
jgi:DNA-binding MarR family transcriptional regulator